MASANVTARRGIYGGLFIVTLSTLMLEILLTRIFSVTMWYHYAFLAISIALFGMTAGAVLVYLMPSHFTQEKTAEHLSMSALGFGVSTVLSFLTYASIPFIEDRSLVGLYSIVFTYAVLSVPFTFSGICVSLALTRFRRSVSRLYAVDLAGAAAGCILVIYTLKLTDGPGAVIVTALLASAAAFCFASGTGSRRLRRVSLASVVLLGLLAGAHTVRAAEQHPLLRLLWVKGNLEEPALFEKWNSFSRLRVDGDPRAVKPPFGWGLSPFVPPNLTARSLDMRIDGNAYTPLTAFHGDVGDLQFLKYDITNLAHYIRHGADVLIIGPGGGRDILSSLVFGDKSVVGVELNGDIIAQVNGRFGDFTGHLDRNPRITFANDEARSYIARQRRRFDIIQASFVDTWAATAAGAFVLSENSLYTVDAWKVFIGRLTPDGLLTFSRAYSRSGAAEMYRMTALAAGSLRESGVANPRAHIVIAALREDSPQGLGTLLVGRRPFSDVDLAILDTVTRTLGFHLIVTPTHSLDATLARLANGEDTRTVGVPLNIAAPTDDSPFFFQMLRPWDLFHRPALGAVERGRIAKAMFILGALFVAVVLLTVACIIVPLALTTEKRALRGAWPLVLFFAGIGFGFMLVEISQMQRLIIFLGHPTYGLSVVLFALLLSSGLGSRLTQALGETSLAAAAAWRLGLLLCALALFGKLTPYAIGAFQAATTPVRISVAAALLFPIGVFMGMAFPLGMKLAGRNFEAVTPWLWGINGATSVCGSVLAVVIALNAGISASFWVGVACYAGAALAFLWACQEDFAALLGPLPARETSPKV